MHSFANITVVIVAFNSGDWLLRAVMSCLQCTEIARVIVCDNASSDDCTSGLPGMARVQVEQLEQNFGFSTACNVGWKLAKTEFVLFLNPDCELQIGQLSQLLHAFNEDSRAGIVSAQLVNEDGSAQKPSLRRAPTPKRAVAQMLGLTSIWPNLGIHVLPPAVAKLVKVDACSGALMLMRKTLLEQLNGFDEGYFLHCEDLDLCRRTIAMGFSVQVDTRVSVLHAKGTSSAAVPKLVQRAKLLGMQRYFEKFDAAKLVLPIRLLFRAVIWLRISAQNLRP
jgi:N-acetylglucosaminyl-diphospho-decaprenol L-rhamnosyltransferase